MKMHIEIIHKLIKKLMSCKQKMSFDEKRKWIIKILIRRQKEVNL